MLVPIITKIVNLSLSTGSLLLKHSLVTPLLKIPSFDKEILSNYLPIKPPSYLKTASSIATSIVNAKLDYCNSLFLNIDVTQINRLQAIQNALVRAVTKTPKHHHITPVLKTLHWLKIPERIEYKVTSFTYMYSTL